ncbi:MAG: formylglycine-generating enzyme family protein, partial [Bacteroidota bacterium]
GGKIMINNNKYWRYTLGNIFLYRYSCDEDTNKQLNELKSEIQEGEESKATYYPLPTAVKELENQMVYVKGGTFTMGCTSEQSNCETDEKPIHQVTLSSFRMSKYEVTQALWKEVMGNNPSRFKGSNLPVEQVSWYDIQSFLQKLNQLTGKNYSLPTEAEWEFAARGGTKGRGYKYAGSDNISSAAWYLGNSESKMHPVGQKTPNEIGLYDMTGNAWEWCQDWYRDYSSSSQQNPRGLDSDSYRVGRGGGWSSSARYCRVSDRYWSTPSDRYDYLGFRLVLRRLV